MNADLENEIETIPIEGENRAASETRVVNARAKKRKTKTPIAAKKVAKKKRQLTHRDDNEEEDDESSTPRKRKPASNAYS